MERHGWVARSLYARCRILFLAYPLTAMPIGNEIDPERTRIVMTLGHWVAFLVAFAGIVGSLVALYYKMDASEVDRRIEITQLGEGINLRLDKIDQKESFVWTGWQQQQWCFYVERDNPEFKAIPAYDKVRGSQKPVSR